MLNDVKENNEGIACFDEGVSTYSLVSEANESNSHADNDAGDKSNFSSDASVDVEIESGTNLGMLILQGEEGEEEGDDESKRSEKSAPLSVPETVFLPSDIETVALPSEIRSTTAVSCLTREQEKQGAKEVEDGSRISGNVSSERSQLLPSVSRRSAGLGGYSFNAMQLFPVLITFLALLSCALWRSHEWENEARRLSEELQKRSALLPLTLSLLKEQENEAGRLSEELQKRSALLPLTLSLLKERESLVEKQKLLEREVIELAKGNGPGKYDFEDIFTPDKSEDDDFLSIKNCYVEASLSLGRCSKEWQSWWSGTADSGANGAEEETSEEFFSYDDGFTDDMSKLVKGFTDSLASTTTQSYSFIEKNLKYLSYDGIKDIFSGDVPSTVESIPKTASNDTGAGGF